MNDGISVAMIGECLPMRVGVWIKVKFAGKID